MIEKIDFVHEQGERTDKRVVVYALSTCGFCRRALGFLKDHGFEYSYCYLDTLPLDVKTTVKEELRGKFKRNLVFPFLVIDDSEVLTGFAQDRWEKALGIPNAET